MLTSETTAIDRAGRRRYRRRARMTRNRERIQGGMLSFAAGETAVTKQRISILKMPGRPIGKATVMAVSARRLRPTGGN